MRMRRFNCLKNSKNMNQGNGRKTMKSLINSIIFFFLFISLCAGMIAASENDFDDTNGSINVNLFVRIPPGSANITYPYPNLIDTIHRSDFIV